MKFTFTYHMLSILFLTIIFSPFIYGQNTTKLLKEGNQYFEAYAYQQAIPYYRDILLQDNSTEAKIKLAECYRLTNDYEKAEYWYKQIIGQMPEDPIYKLYYGQILQSNGKCDEAKKWFLEYAKYDELGNTLAEGCEMSDNFYQNRNKYETTLLPINSKGSDFGVVFYKNGIAFCSNREDISESSSARLQKDRAFLDIYFCEKQMGNSFTPPQKLRGNINGSLNDAPISFNKIQNKAYFTRNSIHRGKKHKSKEGALHLSIFEADLQGDEKWSNVKMLKIANDNKRNYSIAHGVVSQDGQTLYFISDMAGGYGGTDLYQATRIDTTWGQVTNLGAAINSSGNEMFPYVHEDGTLYFASNGHAGMGGLDIFSSEKKGTRWQVPINLGQPFNSSKDDFSIVFNSDKQKGYFASNRQGGFGSDDIYHFVKNDDLTANKNVDPVNFEQPPITNMLLNESLNMEKIRFEKKGAEILPKSNGDLDKLAEFLNNTPEIKVEVGVHTDARGDDFVNLELSSKRAKAVREYLMLKGVSPDRMIARGYGETKLLNHCQNGMNCSNDLHAVNDRLEVAVIAIQGVLNQELLGSSLNSSSVNTKPIIEEKTFVPTTKKGKRIDMSEFEKAENANESESKDEPIIKSQPKNLKDQTEVLSNEKQEDFAETEERAKASRTIENETAQINEKPFKKVAIDSSLEIEKVEVKEAEINAKEQIVFEEKKSDELENEKPTETVIDLGLEIENVIEEKTNIEDAENQGIVANETEYLNEENVETTIAEEDTKMALETSQAMSYKVYVGPYKSVDNDTYYTFVELNTDIDLEYTPKGMMVVLGAYDALADAEKFEELAVEVGAKKTEIKVFKDGEKTDLSIKKLKKMGLK
ncbi:MAG: OmpA family protein [Chitinophagales bacterium]